MQHAPHHHKQTKEIRIWFTKKINKTFFFIEISKLRLQGIPWNKTFVYTKKYSPITKWRRKKKELQSTRIALRCKFRFHGGSTFEQKFRERCKIQQQKKKKKIAPGRRNIDGIRRKTNAAYDICMVQFAPCQCKRPVCFQFAYYFVGSVLLLFLLSFIIIE